ncbi:uncharacterized protein LOC106648985 [Trichogramma pretiosum]|uniref:uncharacterized protein LOC106648985 n=1 Tax=Trichogramma pretiosum TaxID=7493 RepID=UPI0006C97FFD|nr:uncharacterized protein LOC106648985 [Trichogramma pretiosum]
MSVIKILAVHFIALITINNFVQDVEGIACYMCKSVNGSYPPCDDTFHNNQTDNLLASPCFSGRKGRIGSFPASHCNKLTGVYGDDGSTITIRFCSLDSGSLTIDSELVRSSSCGGFVLDGRHVHGCAMSCNDNDGCNSAIRSMSSSIVTIATATSLSLFAFAVVSA